MTKAVIIELKGDILDTVQGNAADVVVAGQTYSGTLTAIITYAPPAAVQPKLPEGTIGMYLGWTVKVESARLNVYPPDILVPRFGKVMGTGSVEGYDPLADFIGMAEKFIDEALSTLNQPSTPPVAPTS